MRARRAGDADGGHRGGFGRDEIETRLAAADQLEIDSGEQPAIDLRPMTGARRQIDVEPPAQGVEARRGAGIALPGHRQGVDMRRRERRAVEPRQLRVQKGEVELGIVDHERVGADELEQLVGDRCKWRMRGEKFLGQAVNPVGILGMSRPGFT